MNLPTLSVVVPNYNHAHYLPECLDSLLQQSVEPLEIMVIDDCSTDNSVAVLEDYCRKHPRVSFCRKGRNRGVLGALNKGAQITSGEYVVFPGADDRVMPGFFEKGMALLAANREAGLCFFDPASFDHITGKISENPDAPQPGAGCISRRRVADVARHKRLLIAGNCIFKRAAFQEVGGYPMKLKWHADYILAFNIAFRRGACYVPEPLSLWRGVPASYMTKGIKQFSVQEAVVMDMLELVNSEGYRGVLPYFKRSGALVWTPFIVPIILRHRKYWHMLSFPLLKRFWMVDLFWSSPHWVQRILRSVKGSLG